MAAMAEVQVASLQARVAEYSARYNQARASLKTAPQLEAEAAQLNRDYAIHKKNYEDLVARRESATMSGDLDVASGMADFRLIDPPRVSPQPVSPNRLLLLPLVLLAAVAGGLFAAFAGSQLRPVFFPSELRAKFEVPFLPVSTVMGDAETRRRADHYGFSRVGQSGVAVCCRLAAMALAAGSSRAAYRTSNASSNQCRAGAVLADATRRRLPAATAAGRSLGRQLPARACVVSKLIRGTGARGILQPNAPVAARRSLA
jgi:hypothetical protein